MQERNKRLRTRSTRCFLHQASARGMRKFVEFVEQRYERLHKLRRAANLWAGTLRHRVFDGWLRALEARKADEEREERAVLRGISAFANQV